MTILVTGGAGFIGSAVCRYLVGELGLAVVNLDKLTYAANLASLATIADDPNYAFERADIADRSALDHIFTTYRPTAVMHLAAESHVDRSITGAAPFIETNIVGTFHLLEAAASYLERADSAKPRRLCYIVDDDIEAACSDEALPVGYRERLSEFYHARHQSIVSASTDILISNPVLRARYRELAPRARLHVIDPVWPKALCERPKLHEVEAGRCRIAYLGTKTHYHDFQLIAPMLCRLLNAYRQVELVTTIAPPPSLARSFRNTTVIKQVPWKPYLQWFAEQSFDIGLYPLRDTRFNRSRSLNKLYEYRLTGALCLSSRNQAFATLGWTSKAQSRFLLGPKLSDWYARLAALIENPERRLAESRQLFGLLDQHRARQAAQSTWQSILTT